MNSSRGQDVGGHVLHLATHSFVLRIVSRSVGAATVMDATTALALTETLFIILIGRFEACAVQISLPPHLEQFHLDARSPKADFSRGAFKKVLLGKTHCEDAVAPSTSLEGIAKVVLRVAVSERLNGLSEPFRNGRL